MFEKKFKEHQRFMQIKIKFSGFITNYIEINLKLVFYHLIASVIIIITS